MLAGDWFIVAMMTLNASAAVAWAYHGFWWKALYWSAAFLLNLSVMRMQ